MKIKGLYAIVDRGISGETLVELARDYAVAGAAIIQLRDKKRLESTASYENFKKTAQAISALRRENPFLFIVNDDPIVALEVGADGVHVGQDDRSVAECRALLGPERVIGYSSHSLAEARAAEALGANYVAFGAIFPTPTKGPGHPVQGIEKLREVVQNLSVPVVAIGGIGRRNIEEVLATHVASVAMISALTGGDGGSEARQREVRYFKNLL